MTSRLDAIVLGGLQVLVVGVPLLYGGNTPAVLRLFCPLVLALLVATVAVRVHRGSTSGTPGVGWLAAFLFIGLLSTVPLPPPLIELISPATAQLYRDALPGWPGAGGWAVWRSLAYDPWAAWTELRRFSIGFGVFTVLVAYPWRETTLDQPGATKVLERLFFTIVAAGLAFAALGALEPVAGVTIWGVEAEPTRRLAGPFVNPDHMAAWFEMMLPVTIGYAVILVGCVRSRLLESAQVGRAVGVQARRAWASALLVNQRRLWPPLVAAATAMTLTAAHAATDSRGGRAALVAGLLFSALGFHALWRSPQVQRLIRRAAPALALSVLAITTAGFLFLARQATEEQEAGSETQTLEVDLGSRLAVADRGTAVVVDHPLVGTGLGSWLHAFRPYQAPPVEDGIWDHAHNDYLEFTAETGLLGAVIVLCFALTVGKALRSDPSHADDSGGADAGGAGDEGGARRRRRRGRQESLLTEFDERDWLKALRDVHAIRWGLAGGVVAILVHSFVDFSLRMPGNLLLLMVLLGLLGLLGRGARSSARMAPAFMLAAVTLTMLVPVLDRLHRIGGAPTLSPDDVLADVDELLADGVDQKQAVALARWAVDRSPANRDAHRTLAEAMGPSDESDDELRRAIALDPWASELRDELALQLWGRDKHTEAAVEIEESMVRYPHLDTHAYLSPESGVFPSNSTAQLLHELVAGETLTSRLAQLDPVMADAIERGLLRALETNLGGDGRNLINRDMITLLEARGRFAEAAATMRAGATVGAEGSELLDRAARDYLKVGDLDKAEEALLAAIKHTPEQGTLYRRLAVDVYAQRQQFDTAETVLDAGTRNAADMEPVYRGITEVLAKREIERPRPMTFPIAERRADLGGESE